ncbi:MAG: NAD-dependent epimerase/dehydratase family protein [Chloroflexota bacterium]
MDILILGGTQFVGRHIVEACVKAGHRISILTRGKTADELPAEIERLHGDRNEGATGLAALADRSWDACVDVSGYTPRQVRASAEQLYQNVKHYVFISTVSVYDETEHHPIYETHPLLPPAAEDVTEINATTYGPLKVTCEHIVKEIYGEQCALLRPQIVAGPYDHTARYAYWVHRVAQGRTILAPGDGSDHVQVIDARDLADFTVKVVEGRLSGVFNLSGPRITWAEFMKALGAENPVWVDTATLRSADLAFAKLPLFIPADDINSSLMNVSNERAKTAGLKLTDPVATAQDTRAWSLNVDLNHVLPPERQAKLLSPERETELIQLTRGT